MVRRVMSVGLAATLLVAGVTGVPAFAAKKHAGRVQEVPVRQVEDVIAKYVKERGEAALAEVQVSVLDPVDPVMVPAGMVSLRILSDSTDGYGRREFDVAVAVNGKRVQTLRATADVTALVDALVTTRSIRTDEIIQAEDVAMARTPASLVARQLLTDPAEAIGKRAVRPLPPNAPLSLTAVAPPYVIRKGERVTIEAKRGGLVVQTAGVTKAVGQVGQVVTVTNQDSGKDIRATVVGPGLVRVEF